MLSSCLDKTPGRMLKHFTIENQRSLGPLVLRLAGRQACHRGCKSIVWSLAMGSLLCALCILLPFQDVEGGDPYIHLLV